jgi:hypothetical protein
MANQDSVDFVTTFPWGILVDTPFGFVTRANEEIEAMHKEVEALQELTFRDEEPTVTTLDLVDMYTNDDGTENTAMTRPLRSKTKEYKDRIKQIQYRIPKIEKYVRSKKGLTMQQRKDDIFALNVIYVDFYINQFKPELEKIEMVLRLIGNKNVQKQKLSLEKAKLVPIDTYIKFRPDGFACCIFPDHNEKTPSMKYFKKKNRVHCFGCGKGGDVVDVLQAIKGCSFEEALKELSP